MARKSKPAAGAETSRKYVLDLLRRKEKAQTDLADAQARITELERELEPAKQQVIDMESHVKDVEKELNAITKNQEGRDMLIELAQGALNTPKTRAAGAKKRGRPKKGPQRKRRSEQELKRIIKDVVKLARSKEIPMSTALGQYLANNPDVGSLSYSYFTTMKNKFNIK